MVSEESASNLQRNLDFAFKWTLDRLNRININKCVVIRYEHNNEKRHFFIDGIQFHESDSERDLRLINLQLTYL